MKCKTYTHLRTISLLLISLARPASAADQGYVIAMGGGEGTPEIYQAWKSLGGGAHARVLPAPYAHGALSARCRPYQCG